MMPPLDIMAGFTPRVSPEELTSFAEDIDAIVERGIRLLDRNYADYEDIVMRVGEALNRNSLTDEEVKKLRECRLHFLERQAAIEKMKLFLLKTKAESHLGVGG